MPKEPTGTETKDTALWIFLSLAVLFVVILPFGIFLVELVSAHRQHLVYDNYKPIPATVLSSEVERIIGSKGSVHYVPKVRYRYEAGGQAFESDQFAAVYTRGSEEWAQDIVRRYRLGESCTVYYDPHDPSKSVLLKLFTFEPYLMMSFFALSVASIVGINLGLWPVPRRPVRADNGWYEVKPKISAARKLLAAKVCAVTWYGLGAIPSIHYFLFAPPPHRAHHLAIFTIFGFLGMIPVTILIRRWKLSRAIADARLLLDQDTVILGRPFKYSISQQAREHVEMRRVRVCLRCAGTTRNGKSSSQVTLRETRSMELARRDLYPGENLEISGELTAPLGQSPSGRDVSGKYRRIDWTIRFESEKPDYAVEFPLTVKSPSPLADMEQRWQTAKPDALAHVQAISPQSAGRILSKWNIFIMYVFGLLPSAILLPAGIIAVKTVITISPSKGTGHAPPPPLPPAEMTKAHRDLAASLAVVAVSSIIGLLYPNLGTVYLRFVARRVIRLRPDAIVRPDDYGTFLEVIPRANWNRAMIENASDIGFLVVDSVRREIRFEGDKERYRIPAEALVSCDLEKSLLLSTAKPSAPGYWLVVLRAFDKSGPLEIPVTPRMVSGVIFHRKARRKVAEELQASVRALLPAAQGSTASKEA